MFFLVARHVYACIMSSTMNDDAASTDEVLLAFLGQDILRELLRAPRVPSFATPTVPPPARAS